MQRRKQKEGRERRGLAPPPPDPRHPEAVLDTVARAAGIDVHKMSLTCTVLVEDGSGRVESETRQYRTYGAELDLLVEWLAGRDLARVVMESTGVFWKAVQRALAEAGVAVWVVNARHVKRVPGRKTDVSDSQWLATLARYGLVNPSFLAPPPLEDLRRLTRLYARKRRVASTLRNMVHRMLDESGLRIGGILTDLFGLSGRNLLDGLVAGRDPEQMMAGVKGKARKKIPALLDALGKGLDEGAKPLVVLLRDMLDAVERSLADLERRILDAVKRDYELPWTLLQTLPGTGTAGRGHPAGRSGRRHGRVRHRPADGELGRHVPGQPRVGRQEQGRKAAQRQRLSATDPLRGRACGGAHARRAVRAVQAGARDPARHGTGGRGNGAQDPAHRVRDAARRPAVPRPAGRLPGAHGNQEQGALAEDAAQGELVAGGRKGGCRAAPRSAGRSPSRAAARRGRTRAGGGLNNGDGRSAHGKSASEGVSTRTGRATPSSQPPTGDSRPDEECRRARSR